jgi:DEAD/DEAH box helicase domain-containing protein
MDVEAFLARVQQSSHYSGQIRGLRSFATRQGHFRVPNSPVPASIGNALAALAPDGLYAHQARSFDLIRAGRNATIATGTASGKTLCFNLPVLASLAEDVDARALYLFPAKALAHDQLGSLERLIADAGLAAAARPACYDGDTATHKRAGIRRTANILLSNPDMLHQSILPYHAKWAGFFGRLRYVVLDEIHTYRGIFGSHVAGVIRRLQRICRHYGADPQFICCSATLGNPRELAERLTGRPTELIDEDASPRGRKWFVLWNPPLEERTAKGPLTLPQPLPAREGGETAPFRRSANAEAQELLQALIEEGAGTIAFCKARVVAELIYKHTTEALRRRRPDLVRRLAPYRGGYLPNERREIEAKLFSGELLGVCCTNALELGIDVGSLDAAIIVGFPGTLCSLWQQAGRAGRRQGESLAIYVGYDDPVDQYLMRNPEFLFERPLEQAVIDPQNPHILAAQLSCAAFELPLGMEDLEAFGPVAADVAEVMAEAGRLRRIDARATPSDPTLSQPLPLKREGSQTGLPSARYYWACAEFPAAQTNLRTISNANFSIVDATDGRNTVIGQVDSISAPELVYPEAVYLHQGETYIVRELDLGARLARVQRLDADYYTQPVLADECRLETERMRGDVLGGRKFFGDVTVKWQTIAFRKFKLYSMELIGQTALNLPAQEVHTSGLWLQPPEPALAAVRAGGLQVHEALSGVRNMLVVALPPLAMCDRYDVGGIVNSSQLGVSTIVIYDRYEGGVGFARNGYERCAALLRLAYDLVAGCTCADGCPGCVGPPNLHVPIHHDPDLGQGYAIPNKHAALALLRAWLT